MTPDRIRYFLHCFYEQYVLECYQDFIIDDAESLSLNKQAYDVQSYFIRHLDVYLDSADFLKEYTILYNPRLFNATKESNPEGFSALQIFLIENIQLFLHTILEAALTTAMAKDTTVKNLRIVILPIDNKTVHLLNLIENAEKKMKATNVLPPAMG